jgi:hypothetical protein
LPGTKAGKDKNDKYRASCSGINVNFQFGSCTLQKLMLINVMNELLGSEKWILLLLIVLLI